MLRKMLGKIFLIVILGILFQISATSVVEATFWGGGPRGHHGGVVVYQQPYHNHVHGQRFDNYIVNFNGWAVGFGPFGSQIAWSQAFDIGNGGMQYICFNGKFAGFYVPNGLYVTTAHGTFYPGQWIRPVRNFSTFPLEQPQVVQPMQIPPQQSSTHPTLSSLGVGYFSVQLPENPNALKYVGQQAYTFVVDQRIKYKSPGGGWYVNPMIGSTVTAIEWIIY